MPRNSVPRSGSNRHALRALWFAVALLSGGASLANAESEASEPCSIAQTDWRPTLKQDFAAAGANRRDLLEQWHAREAYDRVWERTAPLLLASAGSTPPRVQFPGGDAEKPNPRAAMWVGPDDAGCRTIFITPGQQRALGKQEGNWRSRAAALTRALHETAHYFQSDDMLLDPVGRELGASRWASAHGPSILGTERKNRPVEFLSWRDRDQFGSNLGGDPQTFGWPGGNYET